LIDITHYLNGGTHFTIYLSGHVYILKDGIQHASTTM